MVFVPDRAGIRTFLVSARKAAKEAQSRGGLRSAPCQKIVALLAFARIARVLALLIVRFILLLRHCRAFHLRSNRSCLCHSFLFALSATGGAHKRPPLNIPTRTTKGGLRSPFGIPIGRKTRVRNELKLSPFLRKREQVKKVNSSLGLIAASNVAHLFSLSYLISSLT